MATYKKGDDETLSFGIDWSDWLTQEGVDIASSSWVVETGLVNEAEAASLTGTTIFLSGGTAGEVYKVTNIINTTPQAGEVLIAERSFYIAVVLDKTK